MRTALARAAFSSRRFPAYGWLGLGLVGLFWPLNWALPGARTHWCFFPLWLGYCLVVDGLGRWRHGTSLFTRSPIGYAGLFVMSVPLWWLFEAVNLRVQNWRYLGREQFGPLAYACWSSLSFSVVVPAVLGSAELVARTRLVQSLRRGPAIEPSRRNAAVFLVAGCAMFVLLLAWPAWFFPFVWLSLYFAGDAANVLLGNRSLLEWTRARDWRPVGALWVGVLLCGFFWELWNAWSYPKWIYTIPAVDFWRVFEMPLLGYLGYLPFSLEVFAAVHLMLGLVGRGRGDYVATGLGPAGEEAPFDGSPPSR
jgi:hypothetical protein